MKKEDHGFQHIIPQPGDLIFCGTNRLIELEQRRRRIEYPAATHVAIMSGSSTVIEAMGDIKLSKSGVFQYDFQDWLDGRGNQKLVRVFRAREFDLADNLESIYDAITHRRDQDYNFRPLHGDKKHEEDETICSSLALNILLEAKAIRSSDFALNQAIYPGELLELVIGEGFIEYDFEDYSDAVINGIGGFDAFSHATAKDALFSVETAFSDFLAGANISAGEFEKLTVPASLSYFGNVRINQEKRYDEFFRSMYTSICHFSDKVVEIQNTRPPGTKLSDVHFDVVSRNRRAMKQYIQVFVTLALKFYELVTSKDFFDASTVHDNTIALEEVSKPFHALTGLAQNTHEADLPLLIDDDYPIINWREQHFDNLKQQKLFETSLLASLEILRMAHFKLKMIQSELNLKHALLSLEHRK